MLKKSGIETEFKLRRTTGETAFDEVKTSQVEGVSFRYNDIAFKGSQVDRKFSYANLKKEFEKNIGEAQKRKQEEYLQKLSEQKQQQEAQAKAKQEAEERAGNETQAEQGTSPVQPQSKPKIPAIGGIQLNAEQWQTLQQGGHIFLDNINRKDGKGRFSSFVFLNDERNKAFFSKDNPDAFVKYGKYEMRIRDRILIEKGFMTKAKVKWYGIGNFAYPYLWKPDTVTGEDAKKLAAYPLAENSGYCESWGDPRIEKTQKEEQNERVRSVTVDFKKNRGRKM